MSEEEYEEAVEAFQRANNAKETLKDAQRRADYDMQIFGYSTV